MTLVWQDGRVRDAAEATIGVEDRGFLFGDGLFETMRVNGGVVFRLASHLERLSAGAARLGIPLPGGLARAIAELVEAGGLAEAALRLTLTRGVGGEGLELPPTHRPTVVISLRPGPVFPAAWYEGGLSLVIATQRVGARSATAGLKTTGYLPSILALAEARSAGADDALLLNEREEIAEASASNLLWVSSGGALRTPSADCGILPGITRATVLELARAAGQAVEEGEWGIGELAAAREVFTTSSLRGIAPVTTLEGRPIGSGAVGEITRRLMDDYEALFRRETTESSQAEEESGGSAQASAQ